MGFYDITFTITCCETESAAKLTNEVSRIHRMIKLMLDTADDSTVVQYGQIINDMEASE